MTWKEWPDPKPRIVLFSAFNGKKSSPKKNHRCFFEGMVAKKNRKAYHILTLVSFFIIMEVEMNPWKMRSIYRLG